MIGIHSDTRRGQTDRMATPDPIAFGRRRFSIRLPRPLWIGVAAVAATVIGVGLRIGTVVHRQQVAIREIERLGGTVSTEPRGPEWLRGQFGEEGLQPFDRVDSVDLENTSANDAALDYVGSLTEVRDLALFDTYVTDAGLARLKGLTRLEYLSLCNTQISDAGLAHLGSLSSICWLHLSSTQVTDAGLVHLKGLTGLNALSLDHTDISDARVRSLKGLRRLQLLRVQDTRLTEAGIADLRRAMPWLRIEK
jgi:hypothetical protein